MTRPIDFDRLTEEWLSDGPSTMSDRALKAALDEVHVTHQRRLGVARRTYSMNRNLFRIAAAAAAVILVVVVGLAVLGRLPSNLIGSQPTPSPTATPTPTPTPPPSPTPSPTAEPSPSPSPMSFAYLYADSNLAPGTYIVDTNFGLAGITFTVGDGW